MVVGDCCQGLTSKAFSSCLHLGVFDGCSGASFVQGEGEDGGPLLLALTSFASSSHAVDLRLYTYVVRVLD